MIIQVIIQNFFKVWDPTETWRLRDIAKEVFKSFNDLNSNFMKEIFHCSPNQTHRKDSLYRQIL